MNESTTSGVSAALRNLPSIDELLRSAAAGDIRREAGERRTAEIIRDLSDSLRGELIRREEIGVEASRAELFEKILRAANSAWHSEKEKRTRRVINATGVVIHTNLGRAPLSPAAITAVVGEAAGYCTVEYDIDAGKRGKRGERSESLLCQLTGAQAALIVNNCAAAAFLVLTVLARGREVVISRGELVEIGGDFRVPDVLSRSGATLREVGTTNRTKLSDFAGVLNERTAMFLRVHPSNYRITGFTEMPSLCDLATIASENNVVLYEDAGSGALIDLAGYGLSGEPLIAESIRAGADVVSFSGDKLLGGPQAGLIVGRRDLIESLRRDPLYRALRVGKLIYAALEATLESYARDNAETEIPVLRMIAADAEHIDARVTEFAKKLSDELPAGFNVSVIDGRSVIGGGAGPDIQPATKLLAIKGKGFSAVSFERRLRLGTPPVIARLRDDLVMIDLRTVNPNEEEELLFALSAAAGRSA